jgi:hypothetical protein
MCPSNPGWSLYRTIGCKVSDDPRSSVSSHHEQTFKMRKIAQFSGQPTANCGRLPVPRSGQESLLMHNWLHAAQRLFPENRLVRRDSANT